MNAYQGLAGAYDSLTGDVGYERRADYLEKLFARSRIPVHTVLDLACGTGTISCLLAQQGYQVIATDGSEEMLTQAMGKAMALGEGMPLFLQQDMTRLRLAEPVDAAVSTLDSLNYLTREKDVRETFHRVWRWLRPGGQFIFDVNTPYKLQRMDGQIYMDETEESCCVWRTFFSQRTQVCTYQVDLFQLRPDGAWERTFEEHRERAWSRAQLCAWLEEAGFEKIAVTGDLSLRSPREDADRWIIRARKPLAKEEK